MASRSPSGLSGHTSARRSYSAALRPQIHVAAAGPEPRMPFGSGTSHRAAADSASSARRTSACSGVSTPLKMTPMQPDVERLLHDPLRLVGLGRKAREQRDVRLQVALRSTIAALSVMPSRNDRSAGKVERVVLHVGVDEVDRRARRLARVGERQVAGVDEPVDGLAGRELRDDGIQVHLAGLRTHERRQRYRQDDADRTYCDSHRPRC